MKKFKIAATRHRHDDNPTPFRLPENAVQGETPHDSAQRLAERLRAEFQSNAGYASHFLRLTGCFDTEVKVQENTVVIAYTASDWNYPSRVAQSGGCRSRRDLR